MMKTSLGYLERSWGVEGEREEKGNGEMRQAHREKDRLRLVFA